MKVLFVHPFPVGKGSSFIQEDLRLLQSFAEVEELSIAPFVGRFFYEGVFSPRLWAAVRRNDVVFGWFGACTPAILVARLLGRRSVLVGGGGDVADVPSIGYGLGGRSRLWRFSVTLGFRLADESLLFSEASRVSLIEAIGPSPRLKTLYLGVDTDHFRPGGVKQAQVLTVSLITSMNMRRKGIATLMETARLTPDVSYRLVGLPVEAVVVDEIKRTAPPNFTYLGGLDADALLGEYQRSAVYAQLSLHEGFGMALAEAMACDCVPLVTRVGSIPEVAADTGEYVPADDPKAAAAAVRRALDVTKRRSSPREHVMRSFPVAARLSGLRRAVQG
jgi:glycosyltransferase involved in cell wall biosynthesis